MKNLYFGLILILVGCVGFALSAYKIIKGNKQEHGWDGDIPVDPKTGLLHPPPSLSRDDADDLTLWGAHAHLYCKVLVSGSIFHTTRYYNNLCNKTENGKEIDICCNGYKCTKVGLVGGAYCNRLFPLPKPGW